MKRRGNVFYKGHLAGELGQQEDGQFVFFYHPEYMQAPSVSPVSLTLPLQKEAYVAKELFPFFCGLLAEGVLKDLQCRQLKIDETDLFGRLLKTAGSETIGAVTIEETLS